MSAAPHMHPFPGSEARLIVEEELGAPLARLFADFEVEPFAASSLSQVHRAELPDGRRVAVKVQRPGVAEQMERDLELLATVARRLERRSAAAPPFPEACDGEPRYTPGRYRDDIGPPRRRWET